MSDHLDQLAKQAAVRVYEVAVQHGLMGGWYDQLKATGAIRSTIEAATQVLRQQLEQVTQDRDALRATQPAIKPNRFDCPACKSYGVAVDEDGCCRSCGADAVEIHQSEHPKETR